MLNIFTFCHFPECSNVLRWSCCCSRCTRLLVWHCIFQLMFNFSFTATGTSNYYGTFYGDIRVIQKTFSYSGIIALKMWEEKVSPARLNQCKEAVIGICLSPNCVFVYKTCPMILVLNSHAVICRRLEINLSLLLYSLLMFNMTETLCYNSFHHIKRKMNNRQRWNWKQSPQVSHSSRLAAPHLSVTQ